jgi:hypothetical protein
MDDVTNTAYRIFYAGTKIYHVGKLKGDPVPRVEELTIAGFVHPRENLRRVRQVVVFTEKPTLQAIWPSAGFLDHSKVWGKLPKGVKPRQSILLKQITCKIPNLRGYFFFDKWQAIRRIEHMSNMLEKKYEKVLEEVAGYKNRVSKLKMEHQEEQAAERSRIKKLTMEYRNATPV